MQELRAGVTSFLTCVYIVVVTPALLSATGAPSSAVMTSTIIVSFVGALGMGFYANAPFFLAPGLGMNAFFTYTMVVGMGIPLEIALGLVFWSGILLAALSLISFREKLVRLIPESIQWSVSGGIGFFIAFIGLKNGGVIVADPVTLVRMGGGAAHNTVFVLGLAATVSFLLRKNPLGFLPGIVVTTLLVATLGRWWGNGPPLVVYEGLIAIPDFSLFFCLDLLAFFREPYAYLLPLSTLFLIGLIDTLSSFVGVSRVGGLMGKSGKSIISSRKSFLVDAVTMGLSGICGTSPTTYLIESATGIQQGGRTGMAALTMGALLLPLLFFSPLLSMVPLAATAPTLVVTGALMAVSIGRIEWGRLDQAFPAFIVLTLTPLTFSISTGMLGGLAAYGFCRLFSKRQDTHKR